MSVLLVALGAAVGAPLRHLVDRAVQSRHDSGFPWGTLTVNLAGCLALGLLLGAAQAGGVPDGVVVGLGVGLCGAFTTYSTLGYETVRLAADGASWPALANALLNVTLGLALAWAGLLVGSTLGAG